MTCKCGYKMIKNNDSYYCPYCGESISEKSTHMGSDGYARHCCCDKPMRSSKLAEIEAAEFLSSFGLLKVEKIANRVAKSLTSKEIE